MSETPSRKDARHLAAEIAEILNEKKMSDAELSRASKINTAQISRIKNGIQVWVDPADITAIAAACSKTKNSPEFEIIHGRLVYARLQDELAQQIGPGGRFISLNLTTTAPLVLKEAFPSPKRVLPAALQSDLNVIEATILNNQDVRNLVKSIARLARARRPSPAHSKKS